MKELSVLSLILNVFLVSSARGDYENLKKYSGSRVTSKILICKSDQVTAAGYWEESADGSTDVGSQVSKQSKMSTWRIALRDSDADVILFSGASEAIQAPETFSVEFTSGGILLRSKRAQGQSADTITIDRHNSSFVYATQHINPLWNRASIWIGTCTSTI